MAENGTQIDRFWVDHFVKRNSDVLTIQTTKLLEKEQQVISEEDFRHYFVTVPVHSKEVPSLLVWKADETRVGGPKKGARPNVIVTVPKSATTAN
jgi:hypothetical protein